MNVYSSLNSLRKKLFRHDFCFVSLIHKHECDNTSMRKSFKDDTAITKAVEKSTSSARELLRIINQPDSGKSSNQASEEHHSGMSNKTPSDASQDHHSGMSNKTPSDAQHAVEPFHPWLMTATPQSKEEKTSTESLITHRAGIGMKKKTGM